MQWSLETFELQLINYPILVKIWNIPNIVDKINYEIFAITVGNHLPNYLV